MDSISRKRLRTFTCSDADWTAFCDVVRAADPEVSASHALRELMRWYAGGCGGKLKLTIPLRYPPGTGTV
jgi:hypothetical protein